jgi:hypothetical protein
MKISSIRSCGSIWAAAATGLAGSIATTDPAVASPAEFEMAPVVSLAGRQSDTTDDSAHGLGAIGAEWVKGDGGSVLKSAPRDRSIPEALDAGEEAPAACNAGPNG